MARILIVEDSPTQAAQLEMMLSARGYDTISVGDGEAALRRVRSTPVDLIISDIVMPGLSGYELCKRVKGSPGCGHLPVILVSALNEPMDIIRGLECGADNFLTKPYQDEHLATRIATLLGNRSLRSAGRLSIGVDVVFLGRKFTVTSDKEQILDLLISTFEDTVRANRELQQSRADLAAAHAKIGEYANFLEGKVRTSEEKYRSLMANARDGIVILDRDGMVVEANRKAEELFGRRGAEFVGRAWPSLFAAEQASDIDPAELLSAPAARLNDLPIPRPDGSQRWVDISASTVALADAPLIMLILHDVTERRATEAQLREAQKLDALGRLTGGVAHDFNNLLGVIIGNLDLLRGRGSEDPEINELVSEALEAALGGSELTKRLLAFARRQPLAPRAIDLNAVMRGAGPLIRRVLGNEIGLRLVEAGKLWPTLADPAQVDQALLNLAINARDAMPEGGNLLIETANAVLDEDYVAESLDVHQGDYVLLAVADTGSGMTPEAAAQAFEPFFTTKPPGQGTGLGLSMVYGFVKQSGGHVKIYSELGYGTTVKIYLPRAPVPSGAAIEAAPSTPARPGGDERILLVEDNPNLRLVAARVLRELGYQVTEAENAERALALIDGGFDLLFSDIVMPGGMAGPQLAQAARKLQPGLKVLLTSGYSEAFAIPSDGPPPEGALLLKPYRKDELARRVRAALDESTTR